VKVSTLLVKNFDLADFTSVGYAKRGMQRRECMGGEDEGVGQLIVRGKRCGWWEK